MSNVVQPNDQAKKTKDYTFYIIFSILLVAIIGLSAYFLIRNSKVEAAGLFEKAYAEVKKFDELSNLDSKQAMEKEIINILDRVIGKYPNTPSGSRALYYKGYIYYNTQNYEKASQSFKVFINKFNNNYLAKKVYYFLSYCYSEMKKTDEAILTLEVFDKQLKDSYYTPLAYYHLGNLYEIKGDKEKAITYYDKIVKNFSTSSQKENAIKKLLILKNNINL
jgi:TolA-binding protein